MMYSMYTDREFNERCSFTIESWSDADLASRPVDTELMWVKQSRLRCERVRQLGVVSTVSVVSLQCIKLSTHPIHAPVRPSVRHTIRHSRCKSLSISSVSSSFSLSITAHSSSLLYLHRSQLCSGSRIHGDQQEVKVIWQKAPHGGPFPG